MMIRSACASFAIAATVMMGGAVSAHAATPELQPRAKATSCADGRVAVNMDFGPSFKWTLMGIRYAGNSQCNVLITNSGYSGKMVLRYKLTDRFGNVTRSSVSCNGCAELPFGTGGYKKVAIKGIAKTRSGERFATPWRYVKR